MIPTSPKRRTTTRVVTLLLLAATAVVLACGGGGGGGEIAGSAADSTATGLTEQPPEWLVLEPIVPDFVKVVDTAASAPPEVDEAGDVYTFAPGTLGIAGLEPGDIVVGTDGDGYLRRILSTTVLPDGSLQAKTEPASLEEAVEQGSLRVETDDSMAGPMELGDGVSYEPFAASPLEKGASPSDPRFALDFFRGGAFSLKLEHGDITVEAEIGITPITRITMDADVQWFSLQRARFQLELGLRVDFDITVSVNDPGSIQAGKTLATYPIPFAVMLGPVPIKGTVLVNLAWGFECTVAASAHMEGFVEGSLRAGVEYDGVSWRPIWEVPMDGTFEADLGVGGEARTYLRVPEISVDLYGVKGPWVAVEPAAKAEAILDILDCEVKLALTVDVTAKVGFTLRALSKVLADVEFPLATVGIYEKEWVVQLPDCADPPGPIQDLAAYTGSDPGTVGLSWSASGENGYYGTADRYELRYGQGTFAGLGQTAVYAQDWRPLEAGNGESKTLTGLEAGKPYTFVIFAIDSQGNRSEMSNVAGPVQAGFPPGPGGISDLSSSPSSAGSVQLQWSRPAWSEERYRPVEYVVKHSKALITGENFDAATTALELEVQSAYESRLLNGLDPGALYYFAVKTVDAAGNFSPISNVVSAVAAAIDLGPITDLAAATGEIEGTIQLTWTVPEVDGGGSPTLYLVRVSLSPITAETFGQAQSYVQTWVPLGAGSQETRTLSGLTPGATYFVAIKAVYESWGASPMSNVASASAGSDNVPPAAIVDLWATSATTPGAIVLKWTATGDDGYFGAAAGYIVKYSETLITAETFASASAYAEPWTPLPAGGQEEHLVEGLTPGKLYYFAVQVVDEAGDASEMSNVASAIAKAMASVEGLPMDGNYSRSLAAKGDGTVWAWGLKEIVEVVPPDAYGEGGVYEVIIDPSPVQVPGLSNVVDVTVAIDESLALCADGNVWEWSHYPIITAPAQIPGISDVIQISGGYGLRADGTVWAFPWNSSTNQPGAAIQIPGFQGIVEIAGGKFPLLARASDGTVWKPNGGGAVPIPGLAQVVSIAVGDEDGYNKLALDAQGTVWEWGWDPSPKPVTSVYGATAISTGDSFNLALMADGTVRAWGPNSNGYGGQSPVVGLTDVTAIKAADAHCFAQRADGTIWAWGVNDDGQLGIGTPLESTPFLYEPVPKLVLFP